MIKTAMPAIKALIAKGSILGFRVVFKHWSLIAIILRSEVRGLCGVVRKSLGATIVAPDTNLNIHFKVYMFS
jgi:hypothetical protein